MGDIRGHTSTPSLSEDAFYTTATVSHYFSLLTPTHTQHPSLVEKYEV